MSTSYEQLAAWHNRLTTLKSDGCVFRHHLGDTEKSFGPLCLPEVQNSQHGCAHATAYILREVIGEMGRAGELSKDKAFEYSAELSQQSGRMVHEMDFPIALMDLSDVEIGKIEIKQGEVIRRREEITQEVLSVLQRKMRDTNSRSRTPLEIASLA